MVKALWVNAHGSAMQEPTFTREMKRLVQSFSPLLSVTPIGLRRSTITAAYGKEIQTGSTITMEEFIYRLGVVANVNQATMEKNYNRHEALRESLEVQTQVNSSLYNSHQPMNAGPLGEAFIQEHQAMQAAAAAGEDHQEEGSALPALVPTEERLYRISVDDAIWHAELLDWLPFHQKQPAAAILLRSAKGQALLEEAIEVAFADAAAQEEATMEEQAAPEMDAAAQRRQEKGKDKAVEAELPAAKRKAPPNSTSEGLPSKRRSSGRSAAQKAQGPIADQATHEAEPDPVQPWPVDRICDKGFSEDGRLFYLVQWQGPDEPTWEPLANLFGCIEEVERYEWFLDLEKQ